MKWRIFVPSSDFVQENFYIIDTLNIALYRSRFIRLFKHSQMFTEHWDNYSEQQTTVYFCRIPSLHEYERDLETQMQLENELQNVFPNGGMKTLLLFDSHLVFKLDCIFFQFGHH